MAVLRDGSASEILGEESVVEKQCFEDQEKKKTLKKQVCSSV